MGLMKGLFVPEITVEMFRNGCLEAIEALMAEGEIYDIEYDLKSAEPEKTVYIPETKAIPSARSCVDLAEKVTATCYDVEHEEWTQRTMTIADVLDSVCDDYTILPSAQPEEVIPHRNYKYLSDYWCECGWHLGKKGEVKYCAECGRKVNWNG